MLEELSRKINELVASRARKYASASFLIKFIMVVLASGVMGASQFNDVIAVQGGINWWSMTGMVAAVVALIGGILLLVIDGDAASEIAIAHEALERARKLERRWARSEIYLELITHSSALNQVYSLMRATVEQSILDQEKTLHNKIEGLLSASHRHIETASQLRPGMDWTLCIYEMIDESELVLIADQRSKTCSREHARKWPIGVGPAGVAYAQKNEVILDDLFAPELGTIFNVPKDLARDHDESRFRSIAAVPIVSGKEQKRWGVAIATVNQIGHFKAGRFDPDTVATDTIRATAEMVGLLVELENCSVGKQAKAPKEGNRTSA